MRWRRYNGVFAGVALGLAAAIAGLNYAVDPLYVYRYPSRFGTGFYPQDRLLMAGLATHLRYAAVVIGSSYSQNFRPSQMGAALGVPVVNLAVAGATAYEQRLVLSAALRSGQVRRVVWEVTPGAYAGAPDRVHPGAHFPRYLYEPGPLTPVRYLLSGQTLAIATDFMKGKYASDLDRYNNWGERFPAGRKRMIADWCRRGLEPLPPGSAAAPEAVQELAVSLDRNLLAVVRAHPGVRFDAVLPPFSYAAYRLLSSNLVFALRARMAAASSELPNLRVHDFQTERGIVLDLDHYKDESHYGADVNAWMGTAIAAETHLLHAGNRAARDRDLRAVIATPLEFDCHSVVTAPVD
jgi:hypothetical protein